MYDANPTVLNGTVLCMLPAPNRGLEKRKSAIRMLVQARVTEAVVVVIGPQVVDDVIFQLGVGPYALVALVSRTIRLPGRVRVGVIPSLRFPSLDCNSPLIGSREQGRRRRDIAICGSERDPIGLRIGLASGL